MKVIELASISRKDDNTYFKLSIFTVLLYIISLFYNLHVAPLFSEEPRRALVALEMLLNNNYIVTTLLNETFYDHPPLWNIVLSGSFELFGHNTFALRFPSAFSLILTGALLYSMGKKYVNVKFGILSSLYYLVAADLYFFFSITGEIDIFYSLLIVLVFFSIFHFYQQKQFYKLFAFSYFFTMLAFLTKGFASFAFLILTLLIYFIYKKEFKRLFSFPHILFGLLTIGAVSLYFYAYGQYENLNSYITEMWGLTSKRTLLNKSAVDLLKHILLFPINFLAVLFPSTLFILFALKKGQIQRIKEQPFLVFMAIVFFVNFIVYLISPGARIRYTYMFFPMAIAVLAYPFYLQFGQNDWRNKVYHMFFQVLMGLAIGVCFAIPFIEYFSMLPHLKYTMPLFGVSIIILLFLHIKTKSLIKNLFIINFIIICRLVFDHVALPIKAKASSGVPHKIYAHKIHEIVADKGPIYVFSQEDIRTFEQIPFRFYETATYLEMLRNELVVKKFTTDLKGYYIFNMDDLNGQKPLYSFTINKVDLALVKLE